MRSISIARLRPDAAPVQFKEAKAGDVKALRSLLTSYAWSPCVWKGGYRAKSNFLYSDFCALDFDDGRWTIQDATAQLKEDRLEGLIGTTRSHGLPKGEKPACDRFRVIIPWHARVTDLATYEQNMARLCGMLPVDRACKDGARFFFPCREIVHVSWGNGIVWAPYKKPEPPKPREYDRDVARAGIVPPWLDGELKNIREGERNAKCYRFAIRLKERHWTPERVVDLFATYVSLPRDEIERLVRNAWRAT